MAVMMTHLLLLVALTVTVTNAYPTYFIQFIANGVCSAHPTRGYSRHGGPYTEP